MAFVALLAGISAASAVHLRISPYPDVSMSATPIRGGAPAAAPSSAPDDRSQLEQPKPLIVPSCSDSERDWKDSSGRTCAQYHDNRWCTSDGGFGPGWQSSWGLFGLYGSADTACCICGGGNRLGPPVQYLACDSTCELEKHLALERISIIVKSATVNIKKSIASAGANATNKVVNSLNVTMTYYRQKADQDSTNDRTQELSKSRIRFVYLTSNASSVKAAARKAIQIEGYKAAKAAVDYGVAGVDDHKAMTGAYNVYTTWRNVTKKWELAHAWTKMTLDAGWQDWSESEGGIMSVHKLFMDAAIRSNQALANSSVTGHVLRWGQSMGSLAAQLADIAQNRSSSLDEQVSLAEVQVKKAREVTYVSTALLDKVEALVTLAEQRAEAAFRATQAPVV